SVHEVSGVPSPEASADARLKEFVLDSAEEFLKHRKTLAREIKPDEIPTDEQMRADVESAKQINIERQQWLIATLRKRGAIYDEKRARVTRPDFTRDNEIQIQDVGK